MQRFPTRSDSGEPRSAERVEESRMKAQIEEQKDDIKQLEGALEIMTEIGSQELREKFVEMLNDGREAKRQCMELWRDNKEYEDELQVLGREIRMHKRDFDEAQHQNDCLRNQVYELESMGEVLTTPQKRQYPEASGSGGSLYKRPRVSLRGCSREQVRHVLGGPDRGWGSMQGNGTGKYHTLLDIRGHLFGQRPSHKQDVDRAIFGFGQVDNEVISEGILFPLFVNDPSKNTMKITYLGNYTATELDPFSWGKLSMKVKGLIVETVQSKGLSAGENDWKTEKGMDPGSIRQRFRHGIFKVPCCRLKFQGFSKHLDAEIQNTPTRHK